MIVAAYAYDILVPHYLYTHTSPLHHLYSYEVYTGTCTPLLKLPVYLQRRIQKFKLFTVTKIWTCEITVNLGLVVEIWSQ